MMADERSDREAPVAGPQAEAAVTPREPPAAAPAQLSEGQRALLAAVLDRLIPARDSLPGAGTLGVGDQIERTLAVSPRLRRLVIDGLAEIGLASGQSAGRDFGELDGAARDEVLRRVEAARPAFFVALVEHAYRGYYVLPDVHAAIGFEHRPPQPLGHRLDPFDPSLLELQRKRAPFWRRAP